MSIYLDNEFFIFYKNEDKSRGESAILGYDGAERHSDHIFLHHNDEEYTENYI